MQHPVAMPTVEMTQSERAVAWFERRRIQRYNRAYAQAVRFSLAAGREMSELLLNTAHSMAANACDRCASAEGIDQFNGDSLCEDCFRQVEREQEFAERHDHDGGDCMCFEDEDGAERLRAEKYGN